MDLSIRGLSMNGVDIHGFLYSINVHETEIHPFMDYIEPFHELS